MMDDAPHEPVKAWQFLRRHFVRIVIGAVMAVVVYGLLTVWMPYQREQRIAKEILSDGGQVKFVYSGPDWLPQGVRKRLPFLERIHSVVLTGNFVGIKPPRQIPPTVLTELRSLTNLKMLVLDERQFGDTDLEGLSGLTQLEMLSLFHTQITDASVPHLKLRASLFLLQIGDTQISAEGRTVLRKALPNCMILPDP